MENQEKLKEIVINGETFLSENSINQMAESTEGLKAVMVRTYSAGVHFGYLKSKEYTPAGIVVNLVDSRRVWYWAGAMSISQLAIEGSKSLNDCKIAMELPSIELVAIEIIEMTENSFNQLKNSNVWKK